MANEVQITVPDIGDFDAVEVIEVLVSPGDSVDVEDGILTLETDKASMDVPTTVAGEIVSVSVKVGDKISEGDVIAVVRVADEGDTGGDESDDDNPEHEKTQTLSPQAAKQAVAQGAAAARETGGDAGDDDEQDGDAGDAGDAGGAAATKIVTVNVPDIGDFDSVDVIEVEVSVGDEIDIDDPLMTLETDKASMDIPSTHAGKVTKVLVSIGDQVSEGKPIVELETAGGNSSGKSAGKPVEKKAEKTADAPKPAESKPEEPEPEKTGSRSEKTAVSSIDEAGFSKAHASPSVRKLARELGVDLVKVKGSGKKGRIVAGDVKTWVKSTLKGGGASAAGGTASLPAVPKVDFAKFGEVSETPLTRIQKISGPRLQASWINLPHVTQFDEADITDMEARRQALKGKAAERGVKLTPLAFIMRAVVQALAEYPKLNASLSADGSALVNKHYCHIGFAADTDDGLVVPVIHDADKKDVYELAEALADLSTAARDGKLTAKQMQGASFTISSLGGIGGTAFTPIVNAPEVAILGVSRSTMQPVWDGKAFEPRLMLPLSLSYDHRVVDGALAVRFTTQLGKCLSNVDGLLQAIP